MRRITSIALISLICLGASVCSFAASAASNTLMVTFAGEAYDGPPAFVVRFNGTVVGSGEIDAAIDTATEGRLADVGRIEPYLQTFEYTVSPDVFTPTGQVEIELTNDAFDPKTGSDRNIVVYGLLVNGRAVAAGDFIMKLHGADTPVPLFKQHVALYAEGYTAVAPAPASGWPTLGTEPAVAPEPSPDAPSDTVDAAAADTEAAVPEAEVAPITAEVPTPTCEPRSVTITDFGRGLINVPDSQAQTLNAFVADVPPGICRVVVTGYSSVGGRPEVNTNVANARAVAVLEFLKKHGGDFAGEEIKAFGETDQFGPTADENQRVVVDVGP